MNDWIVFNKENTIELKPTFFGWLTSRRVIVNKNIIKGSIYINDKRFVR